MAGLSIFSSQSDAVLTLYLQNPRKEYLPCNQQSQVRIYDSSEFSFSIPVPIYGQRIIYTSNVPTMKYRPDSDYRFCVSEKKNKQMNIGECIPLFILMNIYYTQYFSQETIFQCFSGYSPGKPKYKKILSISPSGVEDPVSCRVSAGQIITS